MAYQDKIEYVRQNIVSNARIYKEVLAGRYYLYIFENQCFEMYYGTDNYMHLTGAESNLSPNQFYKLANSGKLQANQISFSKRFPLRTAIQKSSNLNKLPSFITEGYFVIKEVNTNTAHYPYAITNLDCSILIGLKAEENAEIYIPRSLRVHGKIFEKAQDDNVFEIQAILSKTDIKGLYNNILYSERIKWDNLDMDIVNKIDNKTFQNLKQL